MVSENISLKSARASSSENYGNHKNAEIWKLRKYRRNLWRRIIIEGTWCKILFVFIKNIFRVVKIKFEFGDLTLKVRSCNIKSVAIIFANIHQSLWMCIAWWWLDRVWFLYVRMSSCIFSRNVLSPASFDSNFVSNEARRGSRRRISSGIEWRVEVNQIKGITEMVCMTFDQGLQLRDDKNSLELRDKCHRRNPFSFEGIR